MRRIIRVFSLNLRRIFCSVDTALRDIKDLIEKGILKQEESGGRSTNYEMIEF